MRVWLVAALTGLLAVLLAVLAVVTNLATPLVPDAWKWARDPQVMWGVTGVLMVAVVAVTVVLRRISDGDDDAGPPAGVKQRVRGQSRSASVAWNTGTVINAPAGVVNVHPTAPVSRPGPARQKTPAGVSDLPSTSKGTAAASEAVSTSPARPQGQQGKQAFPRIESVEDSFGHRPFRDGADQFYAHTGFVLTPGQQVIFAVEASDPKGEDVVPSVITPAGRHADVDIRAGKIIWNVRTEDIADPAYVHIYLASTREFHRYSGGYDDAASFGYRVLPSVPEPEERTIVDVTPEYLAGFFDGHTSIQAQKLADAFRGPRTATFPHQHEPPQVRHVRPGKVVERGPLIGKWVKVSGPLGNVGSFTTFSQVTFASTSNVMVYMLFRNRAFAEDTLSVLKKGDEITVLGKIDRIEPLDVQLDNCELVMLERD
jgi:hypothetical protein